VSVVRGPWREDQALLMLEDCVKAERDLWAFCRHCGHATRVRTKELVIKLGFVSLAAAARALRCMRCTRRAGVLLPDRKWPDRN
jgi:hypothetical protein